jgi:hypothetical protein
MEVNGILKLKMETTQVSDKFKKREFILTIDATSPYPQHVNFQLTQDKTSLIDNFNVGEELKVSFNLRGREWQSPQGEVKYFNTIDAWRIEKAGAAQSNNNAQANNNTSMPQNTSAPVFNSTAADDDLPF